MLSRGATWIGLLLLALVLAVQVALGDDENVPWRSLWWDTLQIMSPRERAEPADSPVVIVAIDEATMQAIGTWPWLRYKLAAVVARIAELQASVIAFDLILSKPDPRSPVNLAREFREYGWTGAAEELERLGDTDALFAEILREGSRNDEGQMVVRAVPVVLPVAGVPSFSDEIRDPGCNFPHTGVDVSEGWIGLERGFNAAVSPLPSFIAPGPGLQEAALSAINFSTSSGFVIRRVQAVKRICDTHLLLTGPEALRVSRHQLRSLSVSRMTSALPGRIIWRDSKQK